ncbi:hypothetical protein HF086_017057 [Spodoptera exigua]|uniref:DDE Tnp4 domain-containing protein n=1 Tax=Spodoptera exigua TaxID=7107 RepID=A0A922SCP8_SPOEX|nr:hypothetical protein HF086_017057 [Spodoptera exigua]
MDPYLNTGRNITTDNFFTSVSLAKNLIEKRTSIVVLNRVDLQVPGNQNQPEPQDLHQNPDQSVDVMSITGYKRAANTSNSCLFPDCRADNLTPSVSQRSHRPKSVLGAHLMKIRTEPNERLASRLGMSRRSFERKLELARECLTNDFVPRHLGWDHISRDEIVARNLRIPNAVFGASNDELPAILICDGTYIYIQKSSNFLFQKQSYSLHKFRNLLKPFLIICRDGYIVDVIGPHAATISDATIMSTYIQNEINPMHYVLKSNDTFILDRGFRDSIPTIETWGYQAHMPPTKLRNESQLRTEEANKSRLVTIVRWVVEVINGWIKRDFKIFRQEYFNRAMTHMFVDIRIAAALLNSFREPLKDHPRANDIIQVLNERINMANSLGDYVTENNINRQRASFRTITSNDNELLQFPELTEDDLLLISLGSYQIKLARSYFSEHVRNGMYTIEICIGAIPDLARYNINISEASHPVLHVFPNPNKDPERIEAWRLSVGGHILELTDEHIYNNRWLLISMSDLCRELTRSTTKCPILSCRNIDIMIFGIISDKGRRNEQFKENIPEAVSALSGDAPRPRKRPFACIDYVSACLASTSKEFDRPAFQVNEHYEDTHSASPVVSVD